MSSAPSPEGCEWASTTPGVTAVPSPSIGMVLVPAKGRISSFRPTAANRDPRTANASKRNWVSSTVKTRGLCSTERARERRQPRIPSGASHSPSRTRHWTVRQLGEILRTRGAASASLAGSIVDCGRNVRMPADRSRCVRTPDLFPSRPQEPRLRKGSLPSTGPCGSRLPQQRQLQRNRRSAVEHPPGILTRIGWFADLEGSRSRRQREPAIPDPMMRKGCAPAPLPPRAL